MEIIPPHLSFEKITEIALGDQADSVVREHLKSCTQCEYELNRATQLIELMHADETEDAPPIAIAAILRSFDDYQIENQVTPTPSVGQRLRAILRLDSAQLAPAYGFRSAGVVNSRQLLFSADNGSLDIRITPSDAKWIISGQVLGQITGGTVILKGDSIYYSVLLDQRGEFSLPPVPGGTYRFQLSSDGFEVEVPDLVIS